MAVLDILFSKGLNSKVDYLSAVDGQCMTFTDYQLDYGILRPRTSMNFVLSSSVGGSDQITGVFYWKDAATVSLTLSGYLYAVDITSGKIYRSSVRYLPSAEGSITLTDITGSGTAVSFPVSFDVLNGILVIAGHGGGALSQITSNTVNAAALTGPADNVSIVKTVNNIMFASGGWSAGSAAATVSTIYWSAVSDPTTWPVANSITFRQNDGDYVTALGELNGSLLIFKQNSIGLLNTTTIVTSGTATLGPLSTLFKGIGCLISTAVDSLPDGRCIFVGTDLNVYITDGSTLQSLTDNAPNGTYVHDSLTSFYTGAPSAIFLKYFSVRKEIWVSLSNFSAASSRVLVYDMVQQYWRIVTGTIINCLYVANNVGQFSANTTFPSSVIMAANAAGQIVDLCRDNNATPTDPTGIVVSPNVSTSVVFPENFYNQGLLSLNIIYKSTSTVSYAYGFDGTYTATRTLPASNNRANLVVQIPFPTNSQRPASFQIKFIDTATPGASIYHVFLSNEVND